MARHSILRPDHQSIQSLALHAMAVAAATALTVSQAMPAAAQEIAEAPSRGDSGGIFGPFGAILALAFFAWRLGELIVHGRRQREEREWREAASDDRPAWMPTTAGRLERPAWMADRAGSADDRPEWMSKRS